MGPQLHRRRARGNKHSLSTTQPYIFQVCFALKQANDMKAVVAAKNFLACQRPAIEDKLIAAHQPLDIGAFGWPRRLWREAAGCIVNHLQGLLDMKLPRLALRSDALPGDEQAGAERMDRSGGNEQTLTGADLERVQAVLGPVLADCLAQRATVAAPL